MKPGDLHVASTIVVLAAFGALVWACDEGGDGGEDVDAGGDTDADSDGDSDDCAPVTWGEPTAFTEGQPVGNWTHNGYIDEDGDGYIEEAEEVEVAFSFEDIHCAGYESIVLLIGDTT